MMRSNHVVESDARQERPRALHHGRWASQKPNGDDELE